MTPKPHRPVQLKLAAEGTKVRYLTYVGGGKLTPQIIYGPFLEDKSWSLERRFAVEALRMAKEETATAAWRFLSKTWGKWACRAAQRIGHLTSTETVGSSYARPLQPKWVERDYEANTEQDIQAIADGWKWLQDSLFGVLSGM